MSAPIEAGAVFANQYPFVRSEYESFEVDADGDFSSATLPSWKPGIRYEYVTPYGDMDAFADAVGEQHLTVIDVHKPGRFPTRVFYTRQWVNPDGKVFGKNKLRITTLDAFRRLSRGFWIEYSVKADVTPPIAQVHE